VHAAAKAPGAREEKSEAQAEGNGREAFKEGSAPAFIKDDPSTRFREEVRRAYEEDMAGRPLWGAATGRPALQHACRKTVGLAAAMGLHMQQCMRISTHSIRLGERTREALDPAMNLVDAEDEVEPRVTHRVVASTTVVEETTGAPPSPPVQGEHNYGAKYATRSSEEGFGTRMGQDDEQNVNDPALHAVDAELASKPVPPKQGEASYGDHYHTRSSEEGFGTRMGQDDQPDDPKLHETTN
jgi:hypothetical protein